jgi:hypothetical protein
MGKMGVSANRPANNKKKTRYFVEAFLFLYMLAHEKGFLQRKGYKE